MNYAITSFFLLFTVTTLAQKTDTVYTSGGVEEVYYSFSNDVVNTIDRTTWDIGFTTAGFDASIIINENAGVELYIYGNEISDWDMVDTAGFTWKSIYNSEETWEKGAFANQGTNHPDYGWGQYNNANHDINGDRLFIVKNNDGTFSQMVIEKMSAAGVYTIKIGDLGGANTSTFTLDKTAAEYASKNFIFYNNTNREVVNTDAESDSWDLLFTKYYTGIQAGPEIVYYLVSGIKINKDLAVAERNGVDVSSNDTSSLSWNENITEIGSDWKSFNMTTRSYDIVADRAYFVRKSNGDMWKIYFTNYEGGALGAYHFVVERMAGSASTQHKELNSVSVYPNPASNRLNLVNSETNTMHYSLRSLSGSTVVEGDLAAYQSACLDVSTITSGMYILHLRAGEKATSKKIIIE